MSGKFDDISVQEAMRMAQSDLGQQLLSLIKSQNSQQYQKAASEAATGDYQKMKQTLQGLLSSPEVRTLLEQLRRQANE